MRKNIIQSNLSRFLLMAVCVLLLAGAPLSAQSDSPLLSLLAQVPQSVTQAENLLYFTDFSAMEAAYNTTRPPDGAAFLNRDDDRYKTWWIVMQNQQTSEMMQYAGAIETMPAITGFSVLDVDQTLYFGVPPANGQIFSGSFDAEAVADAYQTNFGFVPYDFDGQQVWCWSEGCEAGFQIDFAARSLENLFGGHLGRRQPMTISDQQLMSSADITVVLDHLSATADSTRSLAAIPEYSAAVHAISQNALLLQAAIADQYIIQGIADLASLLTLQPEQMDAVIESLLETHQDLPPYSLLILADAVSEDEQIARVGLVYPAAETAELAAAILLERLATYASLATRIPFADMLSDYRVTAPRYFIHEEADLAVLVLEFPTRKATEEEILQASLLSGTVPEATPPGLIFRLFMRMIIQRDTAWLSTITRAELEALP